MALEVLLVALVPFSYGFCPLVLPSTRSRRREDHGVGIGVAVISRGSLGTHTPLSTLQYPSDITWVQLSGFSVLMHTFINIWIYNYIIYTFSSTWLFSYKHILENVQESSLHLFPLPLHILAPPAALTSTSLQEQKDYILIWFGGQC